MESIKLQHTGVLAYFSDPNHPHFSGHLEAQPLQSRRPKIAPYISRNAFVISVGICIFFGLVTWTIAAIINMGAYRVGVSAQHTVPVQFKTVYITTTVFSTASSTPLITTSALPTTANLFDEMTRLSPEATQSA